LQLNSSLVHYCTLRDSKKTCQITACQTYNKHIFLSKDKATQTPWGAGKLYHPLNGLVD